MKKILLVIVVVLASVAPATNRRPPRTIHVPSDRGTSYRIGGTATREKGFTSEFRPGLVFELRPDADGSFRISVHPKGIPDRDYAGVLTPPFHGPNSLSILPWELDPHADPTMAPGRTRGFRFARNEPEYTDAREKLSAWSESYGAIGARELDARIEAAAAGVVYLDEVDGVLDQSEAATIQRLKFRVLLSMHKGGSPRCPVHAAHSDSRRLNVYRSRYGFEFTYPSTLELVVEGPDSYELARRAGRRLSGTQEPLLDQIVLRDGAEEIVEIDVAHHPLVDASDQWLWRPCGQH